MKENTLKAVLAGAGSAIIAYFHVMVIPLIVLLVVMIADYISGMTKAWINAELNSRVGIKGIVKKLCYALVIIVAACVDWLIATGLAAVGQDIGKSYYFGILVTVWLIINELISILENLSQIGVPLPGFLQKAVKRLKNSVDKEDEKYAEGKNT